MQLKKRIITGIASTAILLNVLTPMVFADTNLIISGNGADSDNEVKVEMTQSVTVQQSNDADVHNNVDSNASTGGNDANRNTGGSVTVDTGNANSTVNVGTTVNSNQANVQCNTCGGDANITISGNGEDSDNDVDLDLGSKYHDNVSVTQNNDADVHNNVDSNASTGYNDADRNTGGDVEITTGNAKSDVTVKTMANANSAVIAGSQGGSSITAEILGNGADSDNDIDLDVHNSITVLQANDADIHNRVDSDAKTGDNEAERNTGGDVTIDTGDATAKAKVENKVNFNSVDADCGCEMDIKAKIAGNGEDSDNEIEAKHLSSTLGIYQGGRNEDGELGNDADLCNDVDANAKTGYNEIDGSTGSVLGGDPEVSTGNALSDVSVSNTANANVVGPAAEWPDWSGVNLELNFSLGDLLGFLGFHLG